MIPYAGKLFNFDLLLRVHGSAVYKAIVPSAVSTAIYLLLYYFMADGSDLDMIDSRLLSHPYALAALVSAFTFMLTFRANFGYNRYWEGCTAIHHMHSKWLDMAMHLAAFHYQSAKYDHRKPPSYGTYPHLASVVRLRKRKNTMSMTELEYQLNEEMKKVDEEEKRSGIFGFIKNIGNKRKMDKIEKQVKLRTKNSHHTNLNANRRKKGKGPMILKATSVAKLDGGVNSTPSLFLQEAIHLISLLSAVALSTLRVDVDSENIESPLIPHTPGSSLPPVDPDKLTEDIKREYTLVEINKVEKNMMFLLGASRSIKNRTLYNAARPMRVMGGVSDAEIQMLQDANGPMAKVALCELWLIEFLSREILDGSVGSVAQPILSRIHQYCSDGMLGYNQARKVAYVPFPFVHAQISALFTFVLLPLVPFLMLSYVDSVYIAALLNFFTILCFCGLHEVARELENPFTNEPNDIPLVTFQSQFNEALLSMYAGYHPDSWWEVPCASNGSDTVRSDDLPEIQEKTLTSSNNEV